MADNLLEINDAGDTLEINNAGDQLLISVEVVGGVDIVGVHAVPFRAVLQLIPVEFTFWLQSTLIVKTLYRFTLLSTLIKTLESTIKLKSPLLIEVFNSLKLKSLLIKPIWERIKLQSLLVTKTKSIFALESKTKNKKLKKVLLKKLREYLEDDDK